MKGAVTWGQTSDIWAMTVAISDLRYGLKGGLGHHEVESALNAQMTTTHSSIAVNDDGNRLLAAQPDVTTSAIQSAISLNKSTFVTGNPESGAYAVLAGEDIGLAHFYKWAFRLFGYNAYATRRLYLAVLALTCVLFVAAFWRSSGAIGLLTLVVTGLFAATTTNIFHPLLPTISANRFLSTLAVVPLAHLICTVLGLRRMTAATYALLAAQAWLLMFAVSARSSGNWTLIAFVLIALALAWRDLTGQPAAWRRLLRSRAAIVGLSVVAISGVYAELRDAPLDPVYRGEGVLGHHLRWHNAYLALALNPDWPKYKPYPGQNDTLNDNISWTAWDVYAQRHGINPLHPAGIYRNRLLDQAIRNEYFTFAVRHPIYMLELFAIYKPLTYYRVARPMLSSVTPLVWLMIGISALIAGLLLGDPDDGPARDDVWWAGALVFLCAQAPVIWTYAAPHVFADQLWSLMFLLVLSGAGVVCLATRARPNAELATV